MVGRNCDSEPIYLASLLAVNAATGQVLSIRRHRTTVLQVVTLSLVVSGDVNSRRHEEEMFMTRSLNVTPKTTEQHI